MRRLIPRAVWYGAAWIVSAAGLAAWLQDPWGLMVWTSALWAVLAVGYRTGWRWSAWLAVGAWVIGLGLVVGRQASAAVLEAASAFIGLPGAIVMATQAARRRQQQWERQAQASQGVRRALGQRQTALQHDHTALEQTMRQLADLYELTKRLLATVDRREAVRHLADALTGTFPDAAFRLCFIPRATDLPLPLQVIRLQRDGAHESPPAAEDHWLVEQLSQRPVVWSAWPLVGVAEPGPIEIPEGLRTATAFPLVIDGALRGCLIAVGLAPEAVERGGILVSQFALAVRRILLYERVQELAIRDGLTGLFVRRHLMIRLQEEVARAARHDLPLAFLMVDIDHFKVINDTHGHLVGDAVLRDLAALLRTQVREVDLLGRYGGEEFGIALLETDAVQAALAAERIRQAVQAAAFQAYDERLSVTVSIGLSNFLEMAADAAELVERADEAMYRAKQAGRNQVCAGAR